MSFLAELRRRNVIRMAGLYLVGAWLLVQVAETVLPAFDVPSWVLRAIIIVLALGFVPALVFSWVFELTPGGLRRDAEVPPEQSIAPQTARRLDRLIIVVLLLALTYFGFDRMVLAPRRDAVLVATTTRELSKSPAARDTAVVDAKSVAVLPFVDMSEGKDQEYFSDGITEEILNALTRIEDLKVAGRTSSFYFKGRNENIQTIGKTLGVAHLLEGSVRRQGDRVRITAQLIKAADGYHLWSETYDRTLSDIFAIQDEISAAIAAALSSRIMGEVRKIAEAGADPEAYDLYLRARQLLATRTGDNILKAAALFEAASIIDADFEEAFSGRARALSLTWNYVGMTDDDDFVTQAFQAAERALEINPANAEAHSTLGLLNFMHRWDWAAAERETLLAIEHGPNDAEVANFAGDVFRLLGDFDNSLKWEHRALELDPLRAFNHGDLGWALVAQRRCAEAIAPFEKSAELAPTYWTALNGVARANLCLGDLAAAQAAVVRFEQVHVGSQDLLDLKVRLAILEGRPKEARRLLEQLRQRSGRGGVVDYLIAQHHALLGEHAAAALALESAYRRRDPSLAADDLFYLPEDWPDHPGIRAALDKPEWNALFAIRRGHFAKTPRQPPP